MTREATTFDAFICRGLDVLAGALALAWLLCIVAADPRFVVVFAILTGAALIAREAIVRGIERE